MVTEAVRGEGRTKIKSDGMNSALWMKSLAEFAGGFYRKFHSVEARGLLDFIRGRVGRGETQDLNVLKSVLCKMGGVEERSTVPPSAEQLDGFSGGPRLKSETQVSARVRESAFTRCPDVHVGCC